MDIFKTMSFLVLLCAALGYLNAKFLKLPHIIGLVILSLVVAMALKIATESWHLASAERVTNYLNTIDFSKVLLNIMLCFMLFAGSFQANASAIGKEIIPISLLAFFGTILSTAVVGILIWLLFGWSLLWCLVFGALISPTDPIAVLGIISKSKIQERIKTNIIGESLFNDGVGIVIFITLLEIVDSGIGNFSAMHTAMFFLRKAAGGIILGFLSGYLMYELLKTIDSYEVEILLTLALVMGGYFLADALGVSGPLAMVVAGLMVGKLHSKKHLAIPDSEVYLEKFWELVDLAFNSILFVLIGLKISSIYFNSDYFMLGLVAIIIVLLSRFITVKAIAVVFKKYLNMNNKEQTVLVWSGLRGGLSLAMALTLKHSEFGEKIIFVTYMIVLFSIIVQGLTVEKVANRA